MERTTTSTVTDEEYQAAIDAKNHAKDLVLIAELNMVTAQMQLEAAWDALNKLEERILEDVHENLWGS